MTPRELIESQIPTILNERVHIWRETQLHGCEVCDAHEGFECVICRRVVDSMMDKELYSAIVQIGFLMEVLDENGSQSQKE